MGRLVVGFNIFWGGEGEDVVAGGDGRDGYGGLHGVCGHEKTLAPCGARVLFGVLGREEDLAEDVEDWADCGADDWEV